MGTIVAGNPQRTQQVRPERKDGFTAAKRKLFLRRLAATCNVRMSSAAAGIAASSAYAYRRRDAVFAAAWDEALAMGYQRLEEALLLHAMTCLDVGDADVRAEGGEPGEPGEPGDPVEVAQVRELSPAEVQSVLKLMDRHRAAVEGRRPAGKSTRRYTAEETDAALTRQLDALAAKLRRAS